MDITNRREFFKSATLTAAIAATATLPSAEEQDPIVALCEEYEREQGSFRALGLEYENSDMSGHEFDRRADPILERCYEVTDQICSQKAQSIEGLKAQYHHFIEQMNPEIREEYCGRWAAIFDNISAGFEALT